MSKEPTCEEWLTLLHKEIDIATAVNTIAHKINQTILNNDELSKNSILWSWIDSAFLLNIINSLWRIIECEKSGDVRFDDDANFTKFLNKLKAGEYNILSEDQFIHYYDNIDIGDFLKKQHTERKLEYQQLTCGLKTDEMIDTDLKIIKEMRNKIKKFRHEISHLKLHAADKIINYDLKYEDITNSVICLQNLIAKYKNLITATRPRFNTEYHYGNVFDIPWNSKD